MEQFEDLQTLWQSQPAAPAPSVENLMRELRNHTRRSLRIYAAKTILVPLLLLLMLVVMRGSPTAMAGIFLIAAGATVMLTVDWRAQLALSRLEFTTPAAGFARAAVEKLRKLEKPRPVHYAAAIFGPLVGLNLIEATVLVGVSWPWRIAAHFGISLVMVAAMWFGFHVRIRRFENESRPLLERLQAFDRSQ